MFLQEDLHLWKIQHFCISFLLHTSSESEPQQHKTSLKAEWRWWENKRLCFVPLNLLQIYGMSGKFLSSFLTECDSSRLPTGTVSLLAVDAVWVNSQSSHSKNNNSLFIPKLKMWTGVAITTLRTTDFIRLYRLCLLVGLLTLFKTTKGIWKYSRWPTCSFYTYLLTARYFCSLILAVTISNINFIIVHVQCNLCYGHLD